MDRLNPPQKTIANDDPLAAYLGMTVVLDTQGPLLYIGNLSDVAPDTLVLTDADVHDSNDSRSSKEFYLVEARDLGVRANRSAVVVQRHVIASVSLLSDVRN